MPKKTKAEIELAAILKKVNDPAIFRQAVAEDDSAFEEINLAHEQLEKRSRAALAARFGR